ncbi:MAG: ASPIC/UnbV domain-containing protein [Chloroflexia bacterium]
MSMADLDNDGDLDVVVNNLEQPAEIFENRLAAASVCRWNCGSPTLATRVHSVRPCGCTRQGGAHARGAGVERLPLRRPARLHFGLPKGAVVERVEILWPDGKGSSVARPQTGGVLVVRR